MHCPADFALWDNSGYRLMPENPAIPLLNHALDQKSAFTPDNLIDSVRRARHIVEGHIPALCVLEFDGDLTDWLVAQGLAKPVPSWPCFHTTMYAIEVDGFTCGIIPRTIGGPYAVLVAEQLAAAGVQLIIGLIRDEGASLHYLPPSLDVACPAPGVVPLLEQELALTGWSVRRGAVWTTDAPYRETQTQLDHWARQGVLAVEMQAASLFAFGAARGVAVGLVAMVSNAVDHEGEQFDTGSLPDGLRIVQACARAGRRFLA
jgi:Phosphorylase superfamily